MEIALLPAVRLHWRCSFGSSLRVMKLLALGRRDVSPPRHDGGPGAQQTVAQ